MVYPIKLDIDRTFKYGMVASDLIESKLKKPMVRIDVNSLTMKESAIFFWAGLAHEDNKLTPERVMQLADEYTNFADMSELAGKAYVYGMTGKETIEEANAEVTADEKN